MTIDGLMGRVATGLAATALLGMGVHLLGVGSDPAQPLPSAHVTAPDAVPAGSGEAIGLLSESQSPEVWFTDTVTPPGAIVPQPLIEPFAPFTVVEGPIIVGESFESVVSSLGTQVTNSLGPAFMNYSIIMPLSLAPKVLQGFTPMLDAPVVAALPTEAVPVDVLSGF